MTEIWFYHLTEKTLKETLPGLLEKCVERNWKSVVQVGDADKLPEIDQWLWTSREDSFIAHSTERDGNENEQPVFLDRYR